MAEALLWSNYCYILYTLLPWRLAIYINPARYETLKNTVEIKAGSRI